MATTFTFKRKACATCTYWSGPRKINFSSDAVTCDKSNTTGMCGDTRSSFKKRDTRADQNGCSRYEKWNALKK